MTIEKIAQTCYEVNKSYCEIIGDFSQPTWEEAPYWQRSSAINGVNFHLANPYAVGDLQSRETSTAITFLDSALLWLGKRAADLKARGVQGTYQK